MPSSLTELSLDSLIKEFTEVEKSWKHNEDEVIDLLEAMISKIRSDKKIPIDLLNKVGKLGEAWKSTHSQLSKYSKNFEKIVKGELIDLVDEEKINFEHQSAAINQCLLEHLYREGNFEGGDSLAKEMNTLNDPNLKAPFEEMHNLIEAIRSKNINPAIAWSKENEESLGINGLKLQFQLHTLAFVELLKQGAPLLKVIEYARSNLGEFKELFYEDVDSLMGSLAFSKNLHNSPYSKILIDRLWEDAEENLISSYCLIIGLSKESSLRLCLKIGTMAWPKISKILSIMKNRPNVDWNPQEELPIQVDIPNSARFHSIFVCPVLKQQSTAENPPMMMPCGHVISLEALNRLAKGNPSHRFKCPYCPAESTLSMAQKLCF